MVYRTNLYIYMFTNNKRFPEGVHEHNSELIGNQVVLYPENQLPVINVTSDFGDCQVVTSDIYDLFNQQRIANLGPDVIRDFITRNYPSSSAISDEISKMSDSEIMESIKPRNVQSYSELLSWSKYLNERIENGLKSVTPEPTPNSTPEPTPEPTPKAE